MAVTLESHATGRHRGGLRTAVGRKRDGLVGERLACGRIDDVEHEAAVGSPARPSGHRQPDHDPVSRGERRQFDRVDAVLGWAEVGVPGDHGLPLRGSRRRRGVSWAAVGDGFSSRDDPLHIAGGRIGQGRRGGRHAALFGRGGRDIPRVHDVETALRKFAKVAGQGEPAGDDADGGEAGEDARHGNRTSQRRPRARADRARNYAPRRRRGCRVPSGAWLPSGPVVPTMRP